MPSAKNTCKTAYINKISHEIEALVSHGVYVRGNASSSILLIKGQLNEAELAGGLLLDGEDGKALRAALGALGYPPEDGAYLSAQLADHTSSLPAELLVEAITVLSPLTVVLLDDAAADVFREAYAADLALCENFDEALLTPGLVVYVAGLRVLALGQFEHGLAESATKQKMWAWLKQIPPLSDPF